MQRTAYKRRISDWSSDVCSSDLLGLPGNPVSCYVTATLFLLPLIRASMGASEPLPARFMVRLGCALPATGSRHEFPRGIWGGGEEIGRAVLWVNLCPYV